MVKKSVGIVRNLKGETVKFGDFREWRELFQVVDKRHLGWLGGSLVAGSSLLFRHSDFLSG